jgi:RHS repeat-associated protein
MPEVNRLTSALTTSTYATSPSHCWGEVYNPDPWGNLNSIAATTNSNYTGCSEESGFSATPDGNNHLNIFSYDSSGNTQSDGVNSYTWNAESQLKSGGGVNYLYDGDGRRVAKVGSKLYWYGSGGDILAETDASGNTTAEYIFFGGKRVAMLPASGTPIYYVEDLLETSRVVTTNTGVVCYDSDFYPFGGERPYTNTCPQNYKFEGKERDTETGNDDFGARYYSNRFGRWLSADWSSVPAPVPYANLTNPQTLNLYAMVAADPESFADLDGHETAATSPPTQSNGCTGDPKDCTVHPASEDIDRQQGKPTETQNKTDNTQVGNTTSDALAKTMTNEVGSLSTPKKGDPDVLGDAKDALANTLINNANLDNPAKVAPATGTASTQDAQIMKDAVANRAKGGDDPVEGRTQFGTTHNPNVRSRSAGNHLKGAAGRETVYEKFGPFKDSTSRRPTWIVIYNNPGH